MSSSRAGTKLFVAFLILGAAFMLAQPFRQDYARTPQPASFVPDHVVLRETSAPSDVSNLRSDAPTAEIQPTLLTPPPDPADHHPRTEELPRVAPPPTMARSFPANSPFGQQSSQLLEANSGRTLQRTHKVRDGDTLETLAQQYLGDRSRWHEIYQANREKIPQPGLLPLATRLIIPPRGESIARSDSTLESESHGVTQAPLVPLGP